MKEGEQITGCIEQGEHCMGSGAGCDKCRNADGTNGCCEGLEPSGCGAGQTPTCVPIKKDNDGATGMVGCLEAGEKCDGEGVGCEKCKNGTPCCSGEYTGCGAFQTPKCK